MLGTHNLQHALTSLRIGTDKPPCHAAIFTAALLLGERVLSWGKAEKIVLIAAMQGIQDSLKKNIQRLGASK